MSRARAGTHDRLFLSRVHPAQLLNSEILYAAGTGARDVTQQTCVESSERTFKCPRVLSVESDRLGSREKPAHRGPEESRERGGREQRDRADFRERGERERRVSGLSLGVRAQTPRRKVLSRDQAASSRAQREKREDLSREPKPTRPTRHTLRTVRQ